MLCAAVKEALGKAEAWRCQPIHCVYEVKDRWTWRCSNCGEILLSTKYMYTVNCLSITSTCSGFDLLRLSNFSTLILLARQQESSAATPVIPKDWQSFVGTHLNLDWFSKLCRLNSTVVTS